jgi:hypothetical protein
VQVGLEAEKSPQIIFQHYRELVRPAAILASRVPALVRP